MSFINDTKLIKIDLDLIPLELFVFIYRKNIHRAILVLATIWQDYFTVGVTPRCLKHASDGEGDASMLPGHRSSLASSVEPSGN